MWGRVKGEQAAEAAQSIGIREDLGTSVIDYFVLYGLLMVSHEHRKDLGQLRRTGEAGESRDQFHIMVIC